MSMSRDEFREQMRPCLACGALCDGDLCDERCEALYRAENRTHDEREEDDLTVTRIPDRRRNA